MKKILFGLLVGLFALTTAPQPGYAGEIDKLIEKLVDKGYLTPIEGDIIKDETKQQVAAEVAAGKSYALPKWAQKMKLKGDFRLRFQKEKQSQADTEERKRARIRLRLGVEAKVVDKVLVGFGIATGSDDPKSTNQTLQDTFTTKGLQLDYAFAQWQATKKLELIGGKFKRKKWLWLPTDMTWDSDINPEGAAFLYKDSVPGIDNTDFWLSGGFFILDELDQVDNADPFIKYVQGGLKYKEGKLDGKFALTYYHPQALDVAFTHDSEGNNTRNAAGTAFVSNYRSIHLGSEVGVKKPFGGLPFDIDQRIAIFGEFITNMDDGQTELAGKDTTGHAFGVKVGHKKVKKPKSWQAKYIKVKLGEDAWIDSLPDSDRGFGGETGIEGHEVAFKYALKKNVTIGLDYYKTWRIGREGNKEHLFQGDIVFKF